MKKYIKSSLDPHGAVYTIYRKLRNAPQENRVAMIEGIFLGFDTLRALTGYDMEVLDQMYETVLTHKGDTTALDNFMDELN